MDDLIESNTIENEDEFSNLRNQISTTFLDNQKSIICDSDSEEQHISEVISTILNNDNNNQIIENDIIETVKKVDEIDIVNQNDNQEPQQQQQKNLNNNVITRPCQFSVSRIKNIMKLDPELSLTSKESVFLVAKATELFVDFISKESYKYTLQSSRKTIQKKDIEQAVANIDPLYFLEATLD